MARVAIIGYGNIGKSVLEALNSAQDMELCGIVRRDPRNNPPELSGIRVVSDIDQLDNVDAAILCTPSRSVPEYASGLLRKGISTADSYDIHSSIYELKALLDPIAKAGNATAIISAGWDPGSDSIIRALWEASAPRGITWTNFGPGMSMGHSVAVRSVKGVKDALSMTMPKGDGLHRRMVYVELEDGFNAGQIADTIKNDPYFVHDETHVSFVDDVGALRDMGHGVTMERKGVSGSTYNQLFKYDMRINNPALTGQLLVASVRAALAQKPGAYTMIEVPMIDFLEGDREALIRKLV